MINCKLSLWKHWQQQINKIICFVVIALILGLRPILGPALCKFHPTCTQYARECLSTMHFHTAAINIIKRLLQCNPF